MRSLALEPTRGAWAICLLVVALSACDDELPGEAHLATLDSGGPSLDVAVDAAPLAPGEIQAPSRPPEPARPPSADAAPPDPELDAGPADGAAPAPPDSAHGPPDGAHGPPDATPGPPDGAHGPPDSAPGPSDAPPSADPGSPPTDTGPGVEDAQPAPPDGAPAPVDAGPAPQPDMEEEPDAGPVPTPDAGPGPPPDAGPAPTPDAGPEPPPEPPEEVCEPPAGCEALGGPWPAATESPVILVHGMAGFENIGPMDYFYGVPEHLRAHGHGVWVAVTDPFNGTPVRAVQLAAFVDQVLACTCAEEVNLLAHSQGGLDARYLVAALGYADRVASVTTVSTPHDGIVLADVALGLVDGPQAAVVDALASVLGGLYAAPSQDADVAASLYSVSTTGVAQMEEQYPDPGGVTWRSWAGVTGLLTPTSPACDHAENPAPPHGDVVSPALYGAWLLGGGNLVPSDGLVPVASARYGRFRGCIAADHLDEIGQIAGATGGFDQRAFYLSVAEALAAEGF